MPVWEGGMCEWGWLRGQCIAGSVVCCVVRLRGSVLSLPYSLRGTLPPPLLPPPAPVRLHPRGHQRGNHVRRHVHQGPRAEGVADQTGAKPRHRQEHSGDPVRGEACTLDCRVLSSPHYNIDIATAHSYMYTHSIMASYMYVVYTIHFPSLSLSAPPSPSLPLPPWPSLPQHLSTASPKDEDFDCTVAELNKDKNRINDHLPCQLSLPPPSSLLPPLSLFSPLSFLLPPPSSLLTPPSSLFFPPSSLLPPPSSLLFSPPSFLLPPHSVLLLSSP